jgi:hypothetical protein
MSDLNTRLRHPARIKLAVSVADAVAVVPDFEQELPWDCRLHDVRLAVATHLGLGQQDAEAIEMTCPSREYIQKGWPRWSGQRQDMQAGKYSMMKHARRTGWRLELGGGYDTAIDSEQLFLEAKQWSAMQHKVRCLGLL